MKKLIFILLSFTQIFYSHAYTIIAASNLKRDIKLDVICQNFKKNEYVFYLFSIIKEDSDNIQSIRLIRSKLPEDYIAINLPVSNDKFMYLYIYEELSDITWKLFTEKEYASRVSN